MHNQRHLQISVAGIVLSGSESTVRALAEQCTDVTLANPPRFSGATCFAWPLGSRNLMLELTSTIALRRRAFRRLDLRLPFESSPIEEEERQALLSCDGMLMVIDSQRARTVTSVAYAEWLRDCLERAGRRVADLPVVFLLNKLDLPRIELPEVLESQLQWPLCDHFVTVASAGAGVGTR